jgi:tryptophan-rich sensory protein
MWVSIGIIYYLICFSILHRLLTAELFSPLSMAALALVLGVMLSNAGWNYLFFRRRSLRASFVALLPYGALVLALAGLLLSVDPVALAILLPYLVYLVYVTWWTYRLWRNNAPLESPRV